MYVCKMGKAKRAHAISRRWDGRSRGHASLCPPYITYIVACVRNSWFTQFVSRPSRR